MAPTDVPWESCRWFALCALEEYLTDTLADSVLRAFASVSLPDGTTRPAGLADTAIGQLDNGYLESAPDAFNAIPGLIHRYRVARLDLTAMVNEVFKTTGGVLIALAHAQGTWRR